MRAWLPRAAAALAALAGAVLLLLSRVHRAPAPAVRPLLDAGAPALAVLVAAGSQGSRAFTLAGHRDMGQLLATGRAPPPPPDGFEEGPEHRSWRVRADGGAAAALPFHRFFWRGLLASLAQVPQPVPSVAVYLGVPAWDRGLRALLPQLRTLCQQEAGGLGLSVTLHTVLHTGAPSDLAAAHRALARAALLGGGAASVLLAAADELEPSATDWPAALLGALGQPAETRIVALVDGDECAAFVAAYAERATREWLSDATQQQTQRCRTNAPPLRWGAWTDHAGPRSPAGLTAERERALSATWLADGRVLAWTAAAPPPAGGSAADVFLAVP